MNDKGFTLVELMATIVLLAIIMGIGGYAITAVIKNSKEKDYSLLIENINSAVELYYQECKYVNNDCDSKITLGFLVSNGYLKGNATATNDKMILVNPSDGVDISHCVITYSYVDGDLVITAVNPTGSCPKSY